MIHWDVSITCSISTRIISTDNRKGQLWDVCEVRKSCHMLYTYLYTCISISISWCVQYCIVVNRGTMESKFICVFFHQFPAHLSEPNMTLPNSAWLRIDPGQQNNIFLDHLFDNAQHCYDDHVVLYILISSPISIWAFIAYVSSCIFQVMPWGTRNAAWLSMHQIYSHYRMLDYSYTYNTMCWI